MTTETLLLLILIVLIVGALPSWSYSNSWGYTPIGILTFLLVALLVWTVVDGRPLFKRSSGNIEATIQDAGKDIKEAGRDVADSVRDTIK